MCFSIRVFRPQDMSDNPGGGGTSDSIVILSEMLERGVRSCVIATIVDPAVAEDAHAAGERAHTASQIHSSIHRSQPERSLPFPRLLVLYLVVVDSIKPWALSIVECHRTTHSVA